MIFNHLGNARVNFRANGTAVTFQEEMHYYPFGMQMEGISATPVTNNAYKYNGKEWNDDFNLGLNDYGAQWYDAAVGRWWNVNPLAEMAMSENAYAYGGNNPVRNVDIGGLFKLDPAGKYQQVKVTGFLKVLKEMAFLKLVKRW